MSERGSRAEADDYVWRRRALVAEERAEKAERQRDEALVAERHMNVGRDEAIMDGLRYKWQRDEARRAAEAERDALCRMFNQPREERRLPWEREESGDDVAYCDAQEALEALVWRK